MSREAMEAVQDHSQISDPIGRNVFQAIGRFCPANGSPGWVSYRTIADVAHCDKDTAWAWAKRIETAGELKIETKGQGRGAETWFTILLPFDKPKHGAIIGDIKRETSQSGGDNSGGDNIKGMSEQIAILSQQIAELSQQIQKMSQRTSQNVPTIAGTVTRNQKTVTKPVTRGEDAPAPDITPFLKANSIPLPKNDRERSQVVHPAVILWLQVTSQWPMYDNLGGIIDRLGTTPNPERLQKAWSLWTFAGNKRTNIGGVLDWYDNLTADPVWVPNQRFASGDGRHPTPQAQRPAAPSQGLVAIEEGVY